MFGDGSGGFDLQVVTWADGDNTGGGWNIYENDTFLATILWTDPPGGPWDLETFLPDPGDTFFVTAVGNGITFVGESDPSNSVTPVP
jgi:hypothetical protein